ncbi:MAG: hypothetical protein ACRETZ_08810 [Steroidobacteraceae bacterium]
MRLAGDWKLDAAHSDDLGRALQELREQSNKSQPKRRKRQTADTTGEMEGPQQGRRHMRPGEPGGQQGGESGEGGNPSEGGGQGPAMGPMPHVSAMDELMANVPQGDYLTINASSGAFTVTSGDSSNQYTPGQESDISAQQGDAQQISGWKGADYVIDTRPQWGPEIIQSYGLTKDGQLLMKLSLSGRGIRFTFNRLYDRTTRVAPLAPPTTN